MVNLRKGHEISVDWRSQWFRTTVEQVDYSMAKLIFDDGRFEWIYRGSPRLKPLYDNMVSSFKQTIFMMRIVITFDS